MLTVLHTQTELTKRFRTCSKPEQLSSKDTGGSRYTTAGRNFVGGLSMYKEGLADWRREGSTGARVLPGALAAT